MAFECDDPNPDVQSNLNRARTARAIYLRGLLLSMATRARDWVARGLVAAKIPAKPEKKVSSTVWKGNWRVGQ